MLYWVIWQEKSDFKKNPTLQHIARTSSLDSALSIYISLRNDNAMKWVTVGYDKSYPNGSVVSEEVIVKEYVA